MAGTGGVSYERPLVGIWWEPGTEVAADAKVTITAVNAEDTDDVGVKYGVNNGADFLTYAQGTTVTDHVTVTADDQHGEPVLIAEFDLSVKVA